MTELKKLNQQQYYELQAQFDVTPSPFEPYGGSGEHLILCVLLARYGYKEENKIRAWKLANELLLNGWEAGNDTHGYSGQGTAGDVRKGTADNSPRLLELEDNAKAG